MATYSASAFHDSLPSGKESGRLTIDESTIRFESAGGSITIPLTDLSIRRGGAGDRLVFFESQAFPGWSIYTHERLVLRDPHLRAHPATAASLASVSAAKRRSLAITAAMLAAVALTLLALAQLRAPLVAAVARRVPPPVEQKIGNAAWWQIRLGSSEIGDEEILRPLRSLVERLESGLPEAAPYRFELHVLDDPSVNAFALPGGQLAINRGLLMEAENGEEIAGVLAHEMAHVTEQHSLRQIVGTIGLFALVQALFGDTSGLVAVVADGGARLATLGFSRDAEREADRVGVETLRRADIDPSGMIAFFRKLRSIEEGGVAGEVSGKLAFLSTHPATSERIAQLEQMILASGRSSMRPVELDMESLQRALRDRHADSPR
ncbi:MAG TPA: M48 family metallopeptidase [Thermoanaerobaculia bacterium]|nr:M48 family metallopeptidase [Thermoanaerobaculia bacterium]